MIQYRFADLGLNPEEATRLAHPVLGRLARCGPWAFCREGGCLVATQQVTEWQPAGWGEWQSVDGAEQPTEFRLATNQPFLGALRRPKLCRQEASQVDLANGESILIAPARTEGQALGFFGEPIRPSSAYAAAFFALVDGWDEANPPPIAVVVATIRLAIQAGHRLTADAIHARGLISEADIEPYLLACAGGAGKAPPAAAAC